MAKKYYAVKKEESPGSMILGTNARRKQLDFLAQCSNLSIL